MVTSAFEVCWVKTKEVVGLRLRKRGRQRRIRTGELNGFITDSEKNHYNGKQQEFIHKLFVSI